YKRYADSQQQGNFTLYDLGPALNTNFFFFNLNRVRQPKPGKKVGQTYVDPVKYEWFSNPDFRRAVSKAVDRQAMINSVLFGDGVKNWSTTTVGNKTWYTPEATGFDYDPEGAR